MHLCSAKYLVGTNKNHAHWRTERMCLTTWKDVSGDSPGSGCIITRPVQSYWVLHTQCGCPINTENPSQFGLVILRREFTSKILTSEQCPNRLHPFYSQYHMTHKDEDMDANYPLTCTCFFVLRRRATTLPLKSWDIPCLPWTSKRFTIPCIPWNF